jgi:hypothetical protein
MENERLEKEFAKLREGYRLAIERALERVPVRNGVVLLRDLGLWTSLPEDLIIDLLRENGVRMPEHVQRIDLGVGRKGEHGRSR